jgi:hypothetical protein
MSTASEITRLTGVYHADGSLIGELRYVIGHALGRTHCSLCDVTHGRVREKAEWRQACDQLPVPFTAVHLDERSDAEREASDGHTPCVLAHTAGGGVQVLLGPDAIEACAGEPEALRTAIEAALEAAVSPPAPAAPAASSAG